MGLQLVNAEDLQKGDLLAMQLSDSPFELPLTVRQIESVEQDEHGRISVVLAGHRHLHLAPPFLCIVHREDE